MSRLTLTMCAALVGLSACDGAGAGRYIATANDDVLVVVEKVVDGPTEGVKTATAHYVLAKSQVLDPRDARQRLVTRMTYEARFDCRAGAWAATHRRYEFQDGGALDEAEPAAGLERASPQSVAGHIVATVCDPQTAKSARTGRSLEALETRYRDAL